MKEKYEPNSMELEALKKRMKNYIDDYVEEADSYLIGFLEEEFMISDYIQYELNFDSFGTPEEAKSAALTYLFEEYSEGMNAFAGLSDECMDTSEVLKTEVKINLEAFIEDFIDEFESFVDFECEDNTADYLEFLKPQLFTREKLLALYGPERIEEQYQLMVEKYLTPPSEKHVSTDKYQALLIVEKEEDGYICESDDAIDMMSDDFQDYYYDMSTKFEEKVIDVYARAIANYGRLLKAKLDIVFA